MLTPVQDARLKALLIPAELGSLAAVRVRARVEAFVGSMAVWRCRPRSIRTQKPCNQTQAAGTADQSLITSRSAMTQ